MKHLFFLLSLFVVSLTTSAQTTTVEIPCRGCNGTGQVYLMAGWGTCPGCGGRGKNIINVQASSTPVGNNVNTTTIGRSTQKDRSNHRCYKCNQSGTYRCPRCSAPTFGNITYHDCPNCGQRHQSGSHTCRCNDCGGDGIK